jgi:hippurate hydrolase
MATTSSSSTTVLAGLADIRGWQEEFYRDLHQHPELSHQEHRTAAEQMDCRGAVVESIVSDGSSYFLKGRLKGWSSCTVHMTLGAEMGLVPSTPSSSSLAFLTGVTLSKVGCTRLPPWRSRRAHSISTSNATASS